MYLTVSDLKSRLKSAGLRLGGTRDNLLSRCLENGLVTQYEYLATRDNVGSRLNWLTHELGLLGCTLRSDSRLCNSYVEHGIGNPASIATIMREMEFYHEYPEIRQSLYDAAREEYENDCEGCEYDRPRFGEYFCPEEASETAKRQALTEWLSDRSDQEAYDHCELPKSLKVELFALICQIRMERWLRSWCTADEAKDLARDAVFSSCLTRLLNGEFGTVLHALTENRFGEWFGDALVARNKIVRAMHSVRSFAESAHAKGCYSGRSCRDMFIVKAATACAGFHPDQVETIKNVVDEFVQEHANKIKKETEAMKKVSYTSQLDRVDFTSERWFCNKCSYRGGSTGIYN